MTSECLAKSGNEVCFWAGVLDRPETPFVDQAASSLPTSCLCFHSTGIFHNWHRSFDPQLDVSLKLL